MRNILIILFVLFTQVLLAQTVTVNQGGTTTNLGGNVVTTGEITSKQVYADLYDSTDVTTALVTSGYTTLKSWRYRESSNCTITDSTITVLEPGRYQIYCYFSYSFSVNSKVIHASLFINEAETHLEMERKIGTGGDVGNMGGMAIIYLADNAVLKFKAITDGNGNMVRTHSGWVIKKLCN